MTNSALYGQSPSLRSVSALEGHAVDAAPSLGDLFAMHARYVWNTLRRLGVPASELEDVTHDVFLQIHGHLREFDPSRPVRPWLFGFAFRVASNARRRAFRRRETLADTDALPGQAASPEELTSAEQDRRMVLEALLAVDLQRRAVFVLYELDGEAMVDIALSLGIPVNTAYSRLRLARAEFAAAVKRLQAPRRGR
jgi:RNA polymerase sigma-70 factor (ECF subfamily)